jgi:hypothetical protein
MSTNQRAQTGQPRASDSKVEAFESDRQASRRNFLERAMGMTLGGVLAPKGLDFSMQSGTTPDGALQELLDGNRRFTLGKLAAHEKDLAILRQRTVEKQEPFAAVKTGVLAVSICDLTLHAITVNSHAMQMRFRESGGVRWRDCYPFSGT